MSRAGTLLLFALAVVTPVAAHDGAANPALEGEWVITSIEADGEKRPMTSGRVLVIQGEKWIEGSAVSTFTIDPTKDPKQIDLAAGAITLRGIYAITDDRLTVCTTFPFEGNLGDLEKRPVAFSTKRGDPFILSVYERRPKSADVSRPPVWESDWNKAFATAKEQRRLIFVDYYATWCAPCRVMETTVFRDADVRQKLSEFVLLRVDVDRSANARKHSIRVFPTYALYDAGERERFRIEGARPVNGFSQSIDAMRRAAPALIQAAALYEAGKEAGAEIVVGNTYGRLGMEEPARRAYQHAQKSAARSNDQAAAQMAEALSAFTYARQGDAARAIRLLKNLCAKPVNRDNAALLWLTLGHAYREAKDSKSAADAYERAAATAAPDSRVYSEANEALQKLRL